MTKDSENLIAVSIDRRTTAAGVIIALAVNRKPKMRVRTDHTCINIS